MADWLGQTAEAARQGLDPDQGLFQPLSAKAVRGLHQRARDKRQRLLDKALPQDASDELRTAMEAHINKSIRARHDLKPKALQELAASGVEAVKRETKGISIPDFGPFQKFRQALARVQRPRGLHDSLFKGEDRVYMPMPQVKREAGFTERTIRTFLSQCGYQDIDYVAGTCVDDRKNTRKIGRILRKEDPLLFKQFEADSSRSKTDKLLLVLSRDPDDVARMSTNRGWHSCMGPLGMYWHKTLNDIAKGSIIAYVVRETDPDIQDPLSRVLIKRYNKRGFSRDFVLRASMPYGLGVNNLQDTVNQLLNETLNKGKHGTFNLQLGLYADGWEEGEPIKIDPPIDLPAAEYLDAIGVAYTQRDDGTLLVDGDLSFNMREMKLLPDLSQVEVTGKLDLAGNSLKSLVGAPYKVGGDVILSGNPLRTFQHGPKQIGGDLKLGEVNAHFIQVCIAPERELHTIDHMPEVAGSIITSKATFGSVQEFCEDWKAEQLVNSVSPVKPKTGVKIQI